MLKVLILGANGQIARVATKLFLDATEVHLNQYLRHAARLQCGLPSERVRVIEGDVLDEPALLAAMRGQDVVYASLSGAMQAQARLIVRTMKEAGVHRAA